MQNKKICRYCNIDLVLTPSKFRERKLRKPYYFTHTWRCIKCNKFYLDEDFKIINNGELQVDKNQIKLL